MFHHDRGAGVDDQRGSERHRLEQNDAETFEGRGLNECECVPHQPDLPRLVDEAELLESREGGQLRVGLADENQAGCPRVGGPEGPIPVQEFVASLVGVDATGVEQEGVGPSGVGASASGRSMP